ncbi:PilZ domain-containing protein [Bacteriovorax sp. DB6_IX]|uniref:PilZ domain-containing protein n=1 Tax=Bacteriovorax sp. DB6_IX TaxID=1353530 RepID=UPI000389F626|nr:PilZ domain-containing protein [Bacteriovorax sp. DB6_IX]EQC52684.1 type IV pilus assembly protein PilZ [Bacteriovorax sp. DB6_IX]
MSDEGKVINFQAKRSENIEKKRRSFERLLFQNLLGAYTVIDADETVYPVSLVDISHDGCLFQIPWNGKSDKKLPEGHEVKMRMYFTKHSFIPVIVNVRYGNEFKADDGTTYMHYGCEFDKSMPTFKAMEEFINFMYSFAEHSVIDRGDSRAFFL